MKTLTQPIHLAIVTQNRESHSLYESFLQKLEQVILSQFSFIEFKNQISSLEDTIFLVDISSSKDLVEIENISKATNSKLILVTPFDKKFLKLSKNLSNQVDYVISKPLNIKKFSSIVNISLYSINKKNYLKTKEKLLAMAVDNAPLRVAVFSEEGKVMYANTNYLKANNIEIIVEDIYFEDFSKCDLDFKSIVKKMKNTQPLVIEREQNKEWNRSIFYPAEDGKVVHICLDVTEDKNTIHRLKRASMFFEQSNEGMMIVSLKGLILAVNKAFCQITGYTMDEAIGKTPKLLNSGIHEKDFYTNLWDSLHYNGQWQGEIWNKRKSGEIYPQWLSISVVEDNFTKEKNYITIFTDISSIKEADKKLNFYANHDHLTGLLNRVQFENLFSNTIERSKRNNHQFALMFIDLDGFKEVNDTYGHNVGDVLLKMVANLLKKNIRKEDILARIGGDEFNIILDNIGSDEEALEVANKICTLIKEPIVIENNTFFMSFSIGIAIYPKDGDTTIDLSKNADSSMYQVKENGKDGALLYNTNFNKNLERKFTIQNELKKAIKNKEIEVYYQPVYDMKTSKITGAEALARWNHKTLGFIPPDEFIKIAEDSGIILSLGNLIQNMVFEDMQMIKNIVKDKPFVMAINISSREFFEQNFIENIAKKTFDFGLNNHDIELEITETYVMKNHELATERFNKLKELGFLLAIDDFGTGYSSLSYLKHFPIDKLKIDKSFIMDILNDTDDLKIVEVVINLASIFSLETQAEGVETQEHVEILKRLNCDIAQGYHFSKPIDFQNFIEILKREYDAV